MIYRQNINPLSAIIGLLIVIAFLYGFTILAWGAFKLLMYIAPVFFIAAALINHKVYISLWQKIVTRFKTSILSGITFILLLVVGFPIVSLYLFFKALLTNKLEVMQKNFHARSSESFADFEEVDRKSKAEETKIFIPRRTETRLNTGHVEDIDYEEEK